MMPSHPSPGVSASEALLFIGGLGSMAVLGLFIIALGVTPSANTIAEQRLSSVVSAPPAFGRNPWMPTAYGGYMTGLCVACGNISNMIQPNTFLTHSTSALGSGLSAYQGLAPARGRPSRGRLQAMADGELLELMGEIVEESKRRRLAIGDSGGQKSWCEER
jgi:hypothetical protein